MLTSWGMNGLRVHLSCPKIAQFRSWVDQSPSLVLSTHELPHLFMAVLAVKQEPKSFTPMLIWDTEHGTQILLTITLFYYFTLALLYSQGSFAQTNHLIIHSRNFPKDLSTLWWKASADSFCPKVLWISCLKILTLLFPSSWPVAAWSVLSLNQALTMKCLP